MSDAGRKSTITTKVPEWEAELWSYVSHGDGMSCPVHDHCRARESGGWCPDDNRKRLNRLLDKKQFNLGDYDFMEAEAGKQCRLIQLLERLAGTYLRKGRVLVPPVPTELVRLFAQRRDVEIRNLPLKVYHGAIWHQADGWVIQVKESDSPPTMRFTIFHEAFHVLAHCRTTPVFRKRGSIVGSFNEWLADAFASCILMPREWVEEKWVEVGDLAKMAEIFDVSRSAMCIKLRQLGLV